MQASNSSLHSSRHAGVRHTHHRPRVILCQSARSVNPRTENLRQLLKQPGILQGPCCHDGLSARLIEKAGFQFAFMSGFCTAGARLGAPDTGLISYAEMVDTGRNANEATRSIPIIGDGDTGYGNAMNVKRTVRGYAQAGFAGILIEDQVAPKSCGHVKGKRVTSREEAVSRIKAAVDAREEGADILIVARTDARQAVSMEEALWRAAAFADAGADILFIDALESEEEMRRFCWLGGAAARVPKMANMLEGGGKTPILSPRQLQDMGFKLVAYPLSLLGVSIRAMETALTDLKHGKVPGHDQLGSFEDIQAAVGFPEYFAEEAKYAISLPSVSPAAPPSQPAEDNGAAVGSASGHTFEIQQESPRPSHAPSDETFSTSDATSSSFRSYPKAAVTVESIRPASPPRQNDVSARADSKPEPQVIEADEVLEGLNQGMSSLMTINPYKPKTDESSDTDDSADLRSRYFLIKISEPGSGMVKLETRIPAAFLSGLAALVPAAAGINIESLVQKGLRDRTKADPEGALVNIVTATGDKLQIFLVK